MQYYWLVHAALKFQWTVVNFTEATDCHFVINTLK